MVNSGKYWRKEKTTLFDVGLNSHGELHMRPHIDLSNVQFQFFFSNQLMFSRIEVIWQYACRSP